MVQGGPPTEEGRRRCAAWRLGRWCLAAGTQCPGGPVAGTFRLSQLELWPMGARMRGYEAVMSSIVVGVGSFQAGTCLPAKH